MNRSSIMMISTHGYVSAEPQFGLPDTGGQVVFVLELAKRFARAGHQVDIVTRQFEDQPAEETVEENLRIVRIPYGGEKFIRKEDMHDHLDELIWKLKDHVDRHNLHYDIINSHYWDAGWAAQSLAEFLDVKHVHTPHSLGEWKRQGMKSTKNDGEGKYRFTERIVKEKQIYDRCAGLIATSPEQKDQLIDFYGIAVERITVIPPGFDEQKYQPVTAEELKRLRSRFGMHPHDIYAVGRAATNKGYDLLIRSLPHVLEKVPDARLVLAVGANAKRDRRLIEDWKELAEQLGVTERIQWLDYIPDEEMADRYRSAGIFALSSRYEPFGMTAAEAMACGTPTVITQHGGLQDFIEDGRHALVCDPQDPEAFGATLARPLENPDLRKTLSKAGARHAHDRFGWSSIARKTLESFNQDCCEPPAVATV
ncbi:MAG: glycosyltransferase [Phycisphaeraceae bacterium]|nr:glycosyltransferase [Phycisphaeraceae bacterium]